MSRRWWKIIGLVVNVVLSLYSSLLAQEKVPDTLRLELMPVSEIKVVQNGWEFDLAISIQNTSSEALYVPNPLDVYMGYVFRFFLTTPDRDVLLECMPSLYPALTKQAWIRLNLDEIFTFSRHVMVKKGYEEPWDEECEPQPVSDVMVILREKFDTYVLQGKAWYPKPFRDWEKQWIEMQEKTSDDQETVKFWHGEIESNQVTLDFSGAIEKDK